MIILRGHLVGGIGMHSPYFVGPPPNGRLVARVAITARFSYGAITSIACNSHSTCDSTIRDSALVSYFLFQSLPSSSFCSLPEVEILLLLASAKENQNMYIGNV
ncbi:hypothetical protein E1A91_D02G174500v1 [Gossypium mustelinum]|uniref:Uncharacterized protein n=1 Tax=Gossypium mustelinum TaxID=34275 RepID=A0A5D2VX78_GOSMU|nr:hypothetical protein E1A91_D02G174500v1 [Gossypium mustelinum]TYI94012.1 hypothetical protein E1A91_D02G174500v1 [Gossypium mustelinum]